MIPYPNIDPVAVHLGPLAIRWYSLAYIGGILLGWWIFAADQKKHPIPNLTKKALDDMIMWAVGGIILGGRLGYVLFYKPVYYLEHPLQILQVWAGGMSFHGGMIGFIIAFYMFARKYKIYFPSVIDVLVCVAPIGLFFGRIANFINGELYGRVTDAPWGMVFPSGGDQPRHPSQLYEAGMEGIVLFAVLMYLLKFTKVRQRPLFLGGVFLIGYAFSRIIAERFRQPDEFLGFFQGGTTMGQLLSLPMLLLGLYLTGVLTYLSQLLLLPYEYFAQMSLESIIKKRIIKNGPMSIAEYMEIVLTHPKYGYYVRKDPLGAEGDFITAPEISQIFGELIGVWLAAQWIAMGKPKSVLAEFGPGRGTLMADALRGSKHVPGFHEAISVHLVDASPTLRKKQWNKLAGKHHNIQWNASLDEIPEGPLLLVANEFIDALPIRQYIHLEDGWHERHIMIGVDGKLHFTIPAAAGRMVERCEAGKEWAAAISRRMLKYGGAALIIDYGYEGPPPKNSQETLQAMRKHEYQDVLHAPGSADLTALVDFHAIAQAGREEGAMSHGPVGQGEFLEAIGAQARLAKLSENATAEQRKSRMVALERLTSPQDMGELFKVLCLSHPNHPTPEGF